MQRNAIKSCFQCSSNIENFYSPMRKLSKRWNFAFEKRDFRKEKQTKSGKNTVSVASMCNHQIRAANGAGIVSQEVPLLLASVRSSLSVVHVQKNYKHLIGFCANIKHPRRRLQFDRFYVGQGEGATEYSLPRTIHSHACDCSNSLMLRSIRTNRWVDAVS